MIREFKTNVDDWNGKRNWIDQNGVVFGYSDTPSCCETWGWGVFNERTHERLHDSPDGLPYHFDFERGAVKDEYRDLWDMKPRPSSMYEKREDRFIVVLSVVRVYLVPDDGKGESLVFEAFTDHNGYYLHDFSFAKDECRRFVEEPCKETEADKEGTPGMADAGGLLIGMSELGLLAAEAAAVAKRYDRIAVLLRIIDVLEGRQELGKPDDGEKI